MQIVQCSPPFQGHGHDDQEMKCGFFMECFLRGTTVFGLFQNFYGCELKTEKQLMEVFPHIS